MLDVMERKSREARLRWFGHVQRRDSEYRMMRLELPGRRPRGRPKEEIYGRSERGHEVNVRKEDL